MQKTNILCLLLLGSVLIFSCKKQDVTPSSSGNGGSGGHDNTCVQSNTPQSGDIIPGRFIIAYDQSSIQTRQLSTYQMKTTSENVLERNHISPSHLRATFTGSPGGFVADLDANELAALKKDEAISMIEPDRIIALGNCFTVAEPTLITWNVRRVGYGNGIGKTAWIIDTGVDYFHPDLDVDTVRSRSFLNGVNTANDGHGHGTHVAGIIAALNNNIGVLGVASGAKIVSLRVLNSNGEGNISSIIQALSYVNSNARAGDVVNMSLGEDTTSAILNQQVQYTASRGIYIAIAAGNSHASTSLYSPANANGANIYTVSAVDSLDNFASFSNYGNDVDFAAPGVRILSTYPGGRYAYMSGTSMAAPHVAGLLLLKGAAIGRSGSAINDPDGNADPIAHF